MRRFIVLIAVGAVKTFFGVPTGLIMGEIED